MAFHALKSLLRQWWPGTLGARLQRGILWNLLAAVSIQGSTFAANIFIARILGRSTFGEFAIIQTTLLSMSAMVQLSTGITATKYVAEFRTADKDRAGRVLGLCLATVTLMGGIAALVLIFLSPWLATHLLKAPHLSWGLMIGTAFLFFSAVNGYQWGALAGLESFRSMGQTAAAYGIANLAVCSLFTWYWGLLGAVIGLGVGAVLRCLITGWILRAERLRQGILLKFKGILKERSIIFNFAIPAAISGYIGIPALWITNVILVRQPEGFAQMALFSAANSIALMVHFIPGVINNVNTSIINNLKGMGDLPGYYQALKVNVAIVFGIVLFTVAALFILGPVFLSFYGKDFVVGFSVLKLLLIATLPESLGIALCQIINSHGKIWAYLVGVVLPTDATRILLAYLLIPLYQAHGLAMAYIIVRLVQLTGIIALSVIILRPPKPIAALKS